ncbi:hypothetical protein SLA2020_474100 [Shorea laevis]
MTNLFRNWSQPLCISPKALQQWAATWLLPIAYLKQHITQLHVHATVCYSAPHLQHSATPPAMCSSPQWLVQTPQSACLPPKALSIMHGTRLATSNLSTGPF